MSAKTGSVFRLKGSGSNTQPPSQANADLRTVLGAGCSVEGRLVCAGPTRLDGELRGELEADDVLMIDQNAVIVADLNVKEVMVLGKVKGDIVAERRVMLAPTAQVEGDITTPSITIKDGAQVSGKVAVAHVEPDAPEPASVSSISKARETAEG